MRGKCIAIAVGARLEDVARKEASETAFGKTLRQHCSTGHAAKQRGMGGKRKKHKGGGMCKKHERTGSSAGAGDAVCELVFEQSWWLSDPANASPDQQRSLAILGGVVQSHTCASWIAADNPARYAAADAVFHEMASESFPQRGVPLPGVKSEPGEALAAAVAQLRVES